MARRGVPGIRSRRAAPEGVGRRLSLASRCNSRADRGVKARELRHTLISYVPFVRNPAPNLVGAFAWADATIQWVVFRGTGCRPLCQIVRLSRVSLLCSRPLGAFRIIFYTYLLHLLCGSDLIQLDSRASRMDRVLAEACLFLFDVSNLSP